MISAVCVFCGSNLGFRPSYAEAAADLGRALAGRDLDLVYGGGRVGLMGVIADAMLDCLNIPDTAEESEP